jgi:hypothetical protein
MDGRTQSIDGRHFALVALITAIVLAFMFGRVHEQASRAAHQDAIIKADIDWHHRYDVLADSAGEIAVLEAAAREQGGGQ